MESSPHASGPAEREGKVSKSPRGWRGDVRPSARPALDQTSQFPALLSIFFGALTGALLLSGCVGSYTSVKPEKRDQILAASGGEKLLKSEPYEDAHKREELIRLNIEVPGFPDWRRYYWTDKALWGNRGYVLGGPKTEYMVSPEAMAVLGHYEPILEDLRLKLTAVEKKEDRMVVMEQPIYDQRRAFEESQWAKESGMTTSHVVKKGESLWLIAGYPEIYGNPLEWPKLFQANRDRILDPNVIYPGQEFRIPRNVHSASSPFVNRGVILDKA